FPSRASHLPAGSADARSLPAILCRTGFSCRPSIFARPNPAVPVCTGCRVGRARRGALGPADSARPKVSASLLRPANPPPNSPHPAAAVGRRQTIRPARLPPPARPLRPTEGLPLRFTLSHCERRPHPAKQISPKVAFDSVILCRNDSPPSTEEAMILV